MVIKMLIKSCITKSIQTKIQIRYDYLNINPDLEDCLELDYSKFGASWGIQRPIISFSR